MWSLMIGSPAFAGPEEIAHAEQKLLAKSEALKVAVAEAASPDSVGIEHVLRPADEYLAAVQDLVHCASALPARPLPAQIPWLRPLVLRCEDGAETVTSVTFYVDRSGHAFYAGMTTQGPDRPIEYASPVVACVMKSLLYNEIRLPETLRGQRYVLDIPVP